MKGLFQLSSAILFALIADQIFWKADQLVIGKMLNTSAVAVYSVGSQIYMNYTPLGTAISSVFMSKLSKLYDVEKDIQSISELFIKVGRIAFLFLGLTEPSMTRFIMSLEEAVDLVLFAFENGTSGDILVQKAPACTIEVLAKAVTELFAPGHEIKVIGIRHGEKMYETLLTNEECANAIDMGEFYRVPCDKRDLNYDKYFKEGDVERNTLTEFNSSNTELLDVEQVKEKLLTLQYIRDELAEWENR